MKVHRIWRALLTAAAALVVSASAGAQGADPYAAGYCEPLADTKLLYTNRGYLILPKPKDAPAFYYTYSILGSDKKVVRRGQLMFDDGDDHWDFDSHLSTLEQLWPLRPDKHLEIDRTERTTGMRARVAFTVLGLEPIEVAHRQYKSWKIRRLDRYDDGHTFVQFLWYSPELCTLSAFTDSKNRNIKLNRILKPGDKDYDRAVVTKNRKLYFADTNERVK